jgi:DNA-binding response OmpR family regulator
VNPINFNFHILIIEDNEGIRNLARKNLTREGYSVEAVGMGTEALEIIENNPPDLILLDQSLPDISGKEIILKLKERGLNIPFIVMTGQGSEEFAVEMMKLGARDYIHGKSSGSDPQNRFPPRDGRKAETGGGKTFGQ